MIQQKADFFLFIFGSILLFSTKISSRRLFSFNLLVQELNHNREGCIGSWMGTNGAVEGMLCSNSNRQVELKGSQKNTCFLTPSTKMRTLLFCRLPHLCHKASPRWPQLSPRDLSKMVGRHTEARREWNEVISNTSLPQIKQVQGGLNLV